jgi:L-threonine kinase
MKHRHEHLDIVVRRSSAIKMGELVQSHAQGWLLGMPFPVRCTVTAMFSETPGVFIEPASFTKTRRLCELLLQEHNITDVGVRLIVSLPVSIGMGCGTSTTSMRLGVQATADLMGVMIDARWLGQAMAQIEPCDAVCTDGRLLLWQFKRGMPLSCEYSLPHGVFVAAYPRARPLDTDAVDKCRPSYNVEEQERLAQIYESLPDILGNGSLKELADKTSLSAEVNNNYFPKPEIAALRHLRQKGIIEGYFVAHSGSVVGVIGRPGSIKSVFRAFVDVLGAGYDVFGFQNDEKVARLPFLIGCGNTLHHQST